MMQSTYPLLSLAIWMPIAFGLFILAFGRDNNAGLVRGMSLIGSLASLLVTFPLIENFDNAAHGMQFVERFAWIERFNIHYYLGIDGLSLWFVPLTAFITVIVVISAWEVIEQRVAQYMGSFLILSGLMIGVFVSLDGLLFYVFFESTLVPMFIIIGIWGGANRVYAAIKFFLYTFLGSVLMLVAMIANFFIQSSALMITLSVLAIGIFSLFILHDLKRVQDGLETNYISATLGVYLSIYNVFSNLLALLGIFGGDD